jgi:hypothetical protein
MEVHGWDCAFETDLNKIKASKPNNFKLSAQIDINNMNDLLKGYFEFYSTFNFTSPTANTFKIISARTSQTHLVKKDDEIAKKSMHLSKFSDFINIQDPFDLSHNLTANVCQSTVEKFINECKAANELLQYAQPLRKSNSNKCWGLMLLMTRKALTNGSSTTHSTNMNKVELNLTPHQSNQSKEIKFVEFLLKDCLLFEQLIGEKIIPMKRRKPTKVLSEICQQVGSMELNYSSPKRLRIDHKGGEESGVAAVAYLNVGKEEVQDDENEEEVNNNNEKLIETCQFSAMHNTWQGRRPVKRELKQQQQQQNGVLSEIELEKMTSKILVEKSQKPTTNKAINFRVQFLQCENIQNKLKIKFDLIDEPENSQDLANFTTLVHFLDIYIANAQEKLFADWQ